MNKLTHILIKINTTFWENLSQQAKSAYLKGFYYNVPNLGEILIPGQYDLAIRTIYLPLNINPLLDDVSYVKIVDDLVHTAEGINGVVAAYAITDDEIFPAYSQNNTQLAVGDLVLYPLKMNGTTCITQGTIVNISDAEGVTAYRTRTLSIKNSFNGKIKKLYPTYCIYINEPMLKC